MTTARTQELEASATQCLECHRVCLATIQYCLDQQEPSENEHLRLLGTCAEICRTTAFFLLSRSPFHHRLCDLCAEICEVCAKECAAMEDPQMDRCAEACLQCAASSRQLSMRSAAA